MELNGDATTAPKPPLAVVQIELHESGQIAAGLQTREGVHKRNILLMMLEAAKQDLCDKLKAEEQQKVKPATGIHIPNLRG